MSWADCFFENLYASQLLVGWPLCKLEHDPSEGRSLLGNTFTQAENGSDFVNSEPKTNQLPLLRFQTYGMNKTQLHLVLYLTLYSFGLLHSSPQSFFNGKEKKKPLFI